MPEVDSQSNKLDAFKMLSVFFPQVIRPMPEAGESRDDDAQPTRWYQKSIFLPSLVDPVRRFVGFLWSKPLLRKPLYFLWALVPWIGVLALLAFTAGLSEAKPQSRIIPACGAVLTMAAAAALCWRRVGASWDCLLAVLVSIHTSVLYLLVAADLWHPTTSSVKSLMVAWGLTILILAVGLLIRLFRRKLKLALVCFCLILPCYAFSLYVQINVQWFQLEHGQ